MNFNRHSDLVGLHAFLGASKYHWLNYDDEKLVNTFKRQQAVQRGTELHALAAECIRLGVKLPKIKNSLNLYVNDAIGYRMTPEQPLFYSLNSFGTADAICFREGVLRIHDLKTGESPVSMKQLEVYAALFCLEYGESPMDIGMELRIYQSDNVLVHNPDGREIASIANRIVLADKLIDKIKMEE